MSTKSILKTVEITDADAVIAFIEALETADRKSIQNSEDGISKRKYVDIFKSKTKELLD